MRFQRDLHLDDARLTGTVGSGYEIVPNGYHPFSYYVLGGIDLTGDSTTLNGNAESDDSGDMEKASGAGLGYDPRISGFDIAEQAGNDSYEEAREMAKAARVSSQSESSSQTEASSQSEAPSSNE